MDFVKYWLRRRPAILEFASVLSVWFFPVALAWSQAASADERSLGPEEFIEQFVVDVADLTADFEQSVFDADDYLIETSSGRFQLLRPNRFAWYYDSPYELIVIADGESLWMYDVELEQVTVAPLSDLATSPAMILSGEGTVSDAYLVSDFDADDLRRWIELLPVEDDSEFLSAKIAFRDGIPDALELVDGLSQRTRIEFADVDVNSGLRRRDFEFDPPAGVDVIGADD
jgi:outer membrane lipoprotein carrier protein